MTFTASSYGRLEGMNQDFLSLRYASSAVIHSEIGFSVPSEFFGMEKPQALQKLR